MIRRDRKNHRVVKEIIFVAVLLLWQLLLLNQKRNWQDLALVFVGAAVGCWLGGEKRLFPKKEIKDILPLLLAPLTIFVLTSTSGIFGKAIIIFLNLKLILDNKFSKLDNGFHENHH